jgi:hypothetical protein
MLTPIRTVAFLRHLFAAFRILRAHYLNVPHPNNPSTLQCRLEVVYRGSVMGGMYISLYNVLRRSCLENPTRVLLNLGLVRSVWAKHRISIGATHVEREASQLYAVFRK